MNELLVITAIGEDRPGIVDELSHVLYEAELNIADSRMSILGGEFAIILLVSGNAGAIQQFQQQQQGLEENLKLKLIIKPTKARASDSSKIPYSIKVIGMDHPGIVHKLARFLAQHKINIEDLETESYPAPHTGTPMFSVTMSVEIPGEIPVAKLRDEFIQLCDEQNLDAQFSPLE